MIRQTQAVGRARTTHRQYLRKQVCTAQQRNKAKNHWGKNAMKRTLKIEFNDKTTTVG